METSRVLVAENRWTLPGVWTSRKGIRVALLSQEPPGLAPNRGRRDAPPWRVLPLVVVDGWEPAEAKMMDLELHFGVAQPGSVWHNVHEPLFLSILISSN